MADVYFSIRLDDLQSESLIWAACDTNEVQEEMIADFLDSIAEGLNILMDDLKLAANTEHYSEIN